MPPDDPKAYASGSGAGGVEAAGQPQTGCAIAVPGFGPQGGRQVVVAMVYPFFFLDDASSVGV